ncbi:MAG: 5-bromo-4-chloroindolyl phosphate hydrolysis family protein [Alphaproteobacteria bacterium]
MAKLPRTRMPTFWDLFPKRELGNGAVSAGVFLAALLLAGNPLWLAGLLGLGTYAGFRLAVGTDPLRRELLPPVEGMDGEAFVRLIADCRARVQALHDANAGIPSAELTGRLDRICGAATRVVDELERDPKDARRAQRFLVTYLDSAATVAAKYAALAAKDADHAMEHRFAELLETIETTFNRQVDRLMHNDRLDLDIEIELLQKQMQYEGVA